MGTPDQLPKQDEEAKDLLIDFIYEYATAGLVAISFFAIFP